MELGLPLVGNLTHSTISISNMQGVLTNNIKLRLPLVENLTQLLDRDRTI